MSEFSRLFLNGKFDVVPTPVTPGSDASFSRIDRDAASTASGLGYFGPRNDTSKINRFSGAKPRSVVRRLAKPRTSQPAAATRMMASATSIIVIALNHRAV